MIPIQAPPTPSVYLVQTSPGQFNLPVSPADSVFDLRGQTFYLLYSENPDLHTGPGNYIEPGTSSGNIGSRQVNRYPLVNPGDVNASAGTPNAELFGGRIIGNMSVDLDGYINSLNGGYPNSAAVDFRHWSSTHNVVRQMRIDRVWDAIRMNRDVPSGQPVGVVPMTHEVIDCWISNARDDTIECDLAYHGLNITNCLFDKVFGVASYAPSGTIADHSGEDITYTGNLIRLFGFPYGQLQADGVTRIVKPYHISFFKTSTGAKAKMPKLVMHNNVIAADTYIPNNTFNNATGTHWADAFRQVREGSNNVFLWLGEGDVPPVMLDQVPPGFFSYILTGPEALDYWNIRREQWIFDHTSTTAVPVGSGLPGLPKPVEKLENE